MRVPLIAAALLVAVSAAAFAAAPIPAADAPRCLQVDQINHHTATSDREILFYMTNGKVWRNTLRAACPGLRFENAFAWEIRSGEVCANQQVIYVLNRGNPCQLGGFTSYDRSAEHS